MSAFSTTTALSRAFRGALSSKHGPKNYYKGRGAPTMGHHCKSGRYVIDADKFAEGTFKVPDLTGFPLKPYVSRATGLPKTKSTNE